MSDTSVNTRSENASEEVVQTASVGDFIALLKPRVMSLVVFTGFVGLYLAPGDLHPVLACIAVFCIAVGAGASGAINMWYDRDIDTVMTRTKKRPIPAGKIKAGDALAFGVILAVGSIAVMGLAVNWQASALLALTIGFYVFVYTIWLKRRTPQNIVIGGAAGAFPPMIGWAAVTGSVSIESVVLFAIIFIWTPPHFWSLSLFREGDYAAAGVPMLPVVSGRRETQKQILIYSLILAPLAVSPYFLGFASVYFGGFAGVLGLVFLWKAARIWRDATDKNCKSMFAYSILYLFLIYAALIADRLVLAGLGYVG